MKQHFTSLNGVLTGLLVFVLLTAWKPQAIADASPAAPAQTNAAAAAECDGSRTVNVSGAAVVNVTPDRALIQLGVESNDTTPEGVQAQNFQDIQRVINAVRALGVEAKDIATDYYIVQPVYDSYESLYIKGYRIDNTVSITLKDVSLTDDVIIAAFNAGANQVWDVQFYTSELRKYRDQARELAMIAAGEKATALAGAAGAETGCVLTISENSYSYYWGSWWGTQSALWTQNTMVNASPQGDSSQMEDTPISVGQIVVRAEVSVSYGLK